MPPPPSFFLKFSGISELNMYPDFWGAGQGLKFTPPPPLLGGPGPVLGESPSYCLGSCPRALDEVSECGGEGELTQGPQRKLSSLCPPPDTQGGSRGCSWQLWLQLCCCTLPECVTGPNVPGRYPMQGLESLIWFCVLPQTAQSSPKQQFHMVGEGPTQRPS